MELIFTKELYASEAGFLAIQNAMESLESLLVDYRSTESGRSVDELDPHEIPCVKDLQLAAVALAAEGRRHLGMKPLKEGLVNLKDKFFAALSVPE